MLAPEASINDGLLDVVIVHQFPLRDVPRVIEEIKRPTAKGLYIKYFRTPWIESESDEIVPLTLDGEPYRNKKIRFKIVPAAIDLVLPESCPCLVSENTGTDPDKAR